MCKNVEQRFVILKESLLKISKLEDFSQYIKLTDNLDKSEPFVSKFMKEDTCQEMQ